MGRSSHCQATGEKVEKACCIDEIILITAVGMTEECRLVTCFTGAVQLGKRQEVWLRELTDLVDRFSSVTPSSSPCYNISRQALLHDICLGCLYAASLPKDFRHFLSVHISMSLCNDRDATRILSRTELCPKRSFILETCPIHHSGSGTVVFVCLVAICDSRIGHPYV